MKDPYVSLKHIPEEERDPNKEYQQVLPMGVHPSEIFEEVEPPAPKIVEKEAYLKCFKPEKPGFWQRIWNAITYVEPERKITVSVEKGQIVRYRNVSSIPFCSDKYSTFICGSCRHSWKGENDLPTTTCPNCKLNVVK